jgi:hypothetical protein
VSLLAPCCRHALAAAAVAALLLTGCGEEDGTGAGGAGSTRLVDPSKPPPLVNALDIDPVTQEFLLTTNRGFFRIGRESGDVREVRGTVRAGARSAPVGAFLEVAVAGPRRLVGSGHPDREGAVPEYLGVMRSADGGRTWRVLSRLGRADLHTIIFKHGRMYATDAVTGTLLVSRDEGRTFSEQYTPNGVPIDGFDVDPGDPRRIVAASDTELYRSADGGAAWERIGRGSGIRLAWPARDALYRALKDGSVQRSSDGGTSWATTARVGGEPYRFKAVSREELYLALGDGTILHTRDRARTWEEAFRP